MACFECQTPLDVCDRLSLAIAAQGASAAVEKLRGFIAGSDLQSALAMAHRVQHETHWLIQQLKEVEEQPYYRHSDALVYASADSADRIRRAALSIDYQVLVKIIDALYISDGHDRYEIALEAAKRLRDKADGIVASLVSVLDEDPVDLSLDQDDDWAES